jgi:hypothetical protein
VYVLGKWMRRHRTATAMAAIVTLAFAGSVLGVAIQTARATYQRHVAESRLRDLVRLTGTLDGELYDSAKPLAQAEKARATLLQGATQTLDQLQEAAPHDPQLALEMARQYEKLGHLQLTEKGDSVLQTRAARHDLECARALLDGPAGHGPLVAAELQNVTALDNALPR